MRMNWLTIITLSLGITGMSLGATSTETVDRESVHVGIEAGMTFSNVTAPKDVTPSNRSGLAAGLNVEIPLFRYLAIQPEALFVQRGVTLATVGNARLDAKYNSLEFPLLVKARLGGPVSPFLVVGPVAILNLSKSLEGTTPAGATAIRFNPKTLDFGVAVGGGVDIGPLFATLRYTVGVTSLDDSSAEWKSRGFHLLAGLRF